VCVYTEWPGFVFLFELVYAAGSFDCSREQFKKNFSVLRRTRVY